ncbi:MAG: YqgE/AlgH family protein [Gammaproteobacteria bacterium]|nr:YqgE/AlgH family protein [Gammaproteobacteria bacterium]
MASDLSLSNQLLIAMPGMSSPGFSKTVTLICEHNAEGALGIIVNRLSDTNLGEVLCQMGIDTSDPELASRAIHYGGPVEENRGFVLYEPTKTESPQLAVGSELALSSSQDILQALAADEGPERFLIALGYAGWGPGQLEQELLDNTWLTTTCDPSLLFDTPVSQRWRAAADTLGIDLQLLSTEAGHG